MTTKTVRSKSRSTKTLPFRAAKKPRKGVRSADAQPKKALSAVSEQPATPAIPPVEAPKPEILPFDCGEVNPVAPLLTLIEAMFEAPDLPKDFTDRGTQLMASVLHTVADEAELISAAENGLDIRQLKSRASLRLEWRARIAVELARRMQAGEVTS